MNDPKLLRASPEEARRGVANRGGRYLPVLDRFLASDARHRSLLKEVEGLRARQNVSSKEIGKAKAAKNEAGAQKLMAEVARLKADIQDKAKELDAAEAEARDALLSLPNLPHASAPVGRSEADNPEVRSGGRKPESAFKPRDHADAGERLGILDFASGARLAGSRFAVLKGAGARLHRALAQFMLDLHAREHGYTEVWVPCLARPEVLVGTGQLPKFEADLYKTAALAEQPSVAEDAGGLYLIPTSEVPLTNLVREQILDGKNLPLQMTALTPCFRQEAGSYGKDVRGLIRNHQFDKVELVWVTRPEDSMAALEKLTGHAEAVLKRLGLPYRVIELCTADLGFASCKTYDLEVWFPGEGRYREVSSCSNCSDFQARRMNARFRRAPDAPPEFVHTLNGSGLAVGRLFAALLENGQREDGSVAVPEALRPYFGADELR